MIVELVKFVSCHVVIALAVFIPSIYIMSQILVLEIPPAQPVIRRRAEKRNARASRRSAKRRHALREEELQTEIRVTNTIMTDLSIISTADSNSSTQIVNDPRIAVPDELIALETLAEWESRPIALRPPLEKVATFISEMYMSVPYGTTDLIEITLLQSNCEHLFRAFHTIRKEFLFAALHIAVAVQTTISNKKKDL